jgi:N utilization substance protein B
LFHLDFQNPSNERIEEGAPETDHCPDADFWRLRTGMNDPEDLPSAEPRPPIAPKAKAFAEKLVRGVITYRQEIDELITKYARNYRLSRLAVVDRNILRLAIYEIFHSAEVPPVVAINEAIELAKAYGSEESGRFVNGLLDRIRAESPRPPRDASRASNKP